MGGKRGRRKLVRIRGRWKGATVSIRIVSFLLAFKLPVCLISFFLLHFAFSSTLMVRFVHHG